jgi:carbon monoxide dehydrogenase subunit G
MTNIESRKGSIKKSQKEVFDFLSDFNHFKDLMPEQVTDWRSDTESCAFTLKGMASLGMKFEKKIPHSEITIIPDGKVPFDFRLICLMAPDNNQTILQLRFEADLNPFLKMMAEKPLKNFLDLLIARAETLF